MAAAATTEKPVAPAGMIRVATEELEEHGSPPCLLPARPMAECKAEGSGLLAITDEPYFLPGELGMLQDAERLLLRTGAVTGFMRLDPDGGKLENGKPYPAGCAWACRIFRAVSQVAGADTRAGTRAQNPGIGRGAPGVAKVRACKACGERYKIKGALRCPHCGEVVR